MRALAIKKLPQEIYMKIAAGEVVTSAGSVVKELIENAIDSGATTIRLEIKNGGKDTIKVSDNGGGISSQDIYLAVQPHATSKIEHWDDILDLDTFGFRGEALSSIASVSEFYLFSKTQDSDTGISLFYRGSQLVEEKRIPMNRGTTVEVRNLFFNVPARRKFLKTSASESRYVLDVLEKFLLSKPDVAFEMIRDGNRVYSCLKEPLKIRIQNVLKVNDPNQLLDVNHQQGAFSVVGAVSSPELSRPNMTGITTFVNERFVKDPIVYAAVRDFFTPLLGKGRYPVAVLFMTIPKSEVDINVHPQKLEVKYSESSTVYSLIKNALKSAFSNQSMQIKEAFSTLNSTNQNHPVKSFQSQDRQLGHRAEYVKDIHMNEYSPGLLYKSQRQPQILQPILDQPDFTKQPVSDKQTIFSSDKILGIANKRYIVMEDATGLVLVDFHAAHERVLYEKIRKSEKKLLIQKLLEPLSIEIDTASNQILQEQTEAFASLGFCYELNKGSVKITGIPNIIKQQDAVDVLLEIIDEFRVTELEKESQVYDHIYATIACHHAFRTGDFITLEQARELLKEMKDYEVFSCPHGRPVKYKLSFSQLDDYFKRS